MLENVRSIHMVGIGGTGMSGIARVLAERGYRVDGCDVKDSHLTEQLRAAGIPVTLGHDPAHLRGVDAIVYTSAVPASSPELTAARRAGKPLWHRSEVLAWVLHEGFGIAVSGTHGKTTTTAMVGTVLEKCGQDPTILLGGELDLIGSNAKLGRGKYVVAEACESDGSLLRYRPSVAVVTNIEADHLENYGGEFGSIVATFERFVGNVRQGGVAVLCGDDERIREMLPRLRTRVVTYGLGEHDLAAGEMSFDRNSAVFAARRRGRRLGKVALRVPGRHNVVNALAAIAVGLELGLGFDEIRRALAAFAGVKRRFEIVGEVGGITVVDDYAHNPAKVRATLGAAREGWGRRTVAVFQPHRYARTYYLLGELSNSFAQADEVIITDIYSPAGEPPMDGVSAASLVRLMSEKGTKDVRLISSRGEIVDYLLHATRAGDLVVTMGAGDVWKVAAEFCARLREKEALDSVAASAEMG